MKRKALYFMLIAHCFLFCACATFPRQGEPSQKSNLTPATVKYQIIKGKTSQAEVLKLLGSPNIITKNRDNDEVWNYNRMSFEYMDGADGGGFIFWGGSRAMSTATTKSFDLIITFDQNDIVKEYSMISASF